MSLFAALAAGGTVGVTHALEADHLAAVATLVEDSDRPGLVGASWGVGHTLPIAALGVAFLALGVRVPEGLTGLFELLVGVVLVAYGLRLLGRATGHLDTATHSHDGDGHTHLRLGRVSLGLTHTHLDGDSAFVGILHGLAGSGALVVAMVSAAPTVDAALSFLLAFGLLTTATMAAVSAVWGRAVGAWATGFRALGGLVGMLVGTALVAEVALGVAVLP